MVEGSEELLDALKVNRGVIVVGPPSARVAALLTTVQDAATISGWSVVRARATASSTRIPLAPFADLVPPGTGGGLLDRLRAVIDAVGQLGARTVLIVDDAHALDEASVIALRHVHAATKARFLLGVRDEAHLPDGARSVVDGGPVIELPHVLHEVVMLDDDAREVVDVLRLASPLDRRVLEHATSHEALAELVRRGIVEVALEGRRGELRLAHETDADGVSGATKRRLLDALEAVGARRYGDPLRIALLRAELGILEDPSALLAAARDLEVLHHRSVFTGVSGGLREPLPACLEAGLRFARLALDVTQRMPEVVVVIDLLSALGRTSEAAALLGELDRYVVDAADEAMATRLRAQVLFVIGRPDAARDKLLAAEAATTDVEHRTWFRVARLQIEGLCGRYRDAVATGDQLRADGVRIGTGTGAGALAFGMVRVGRCADAAALLDSVFAAVTGDEDPRYVVAEAYAQILALGTLGRLDDAEERAASAVAVHTAAGNDEQVAFAHIALAGLALARGRVRRAAEIADDVIAGLGDRDVFGFRRIALAVAATAHALLAEDQRAAELLSDLDVAPAGVHAFESDVRRAHAWALVGRGDVAGAAALLVDAAEAARVEGLDGDEVGMLYDLVRLGHPADAVDRLDALAVTSQGPYPALARDHARALLSGDGDALDDVAARAVAIGAVLLALDATAHAEAAHLAAGDCERAASAHEWACELQAACDGAVTAAFGPRG